MVRKNEYADIRVRQEEFCVLWGCDRYEEKAACAFCPFIRDVLDMADEMAMDVPALKLMAVMRRN